MIWHATDGLEGILVREMIPLMKMPIRCGLRMMILLNVALIRAILEIFRVTFVYIPSFHQVLLL